MAVKCGGLDINIRLGISLGLDGEDPAGIVRRIQVENHPVEQRAGQIVARPDGTATLHFKQPHRHHNKVGAHLTFIFLAHPAGVRRQLEIIPQHQARVFLRQPRFAGIVEEERGLQIRFVAEVHVAFGKSLFQPRIKLVRTQQFDESGQIVRHKPGVNPCVAFNKSGAVPAAFGAEMKRIERLHPRTIRMPAANVLNLRIKHVPIILRTFE